jgi:hypothetical protein
MGLDQALDRMRAAIQSQNDPVTIPFTEALMWLYMLHEWHKSHMGLGKNPEKFAAVCSCSAEGKAFIAVIWARGLLTHAGGDVGGLTMRAMSQMLGPVLFGISWPFLGWSETAALPKYQKNLPRNQLGETLYDVHVSGKPLIEPLEAAQAFVKGIQIARSLAGGA